MSWSPWARELDESNIKKLISLWPAGLIPGNKDLVYVSFMH